MDFQDRPSAYFGVRVIVGDAVRLYLTGDLDIAAAPMLADALERHAGHQMPLIVDCRDITFIDAYGIRALIAAVTAVDARVVNPSAPVDRVVDLVRYRDVWRELVAHITDTGALPPH